MSSKLIILSNRVNIPAKGKPNTGGLAVAVTSVLKKFGGVWMGFSGKFSSETKVSEVKKGEIAYRLIDLKEEQYNNYYLGYSNNTLWPIFHYRMEVAKHSSEYWSDYLEVNQIFANECFKIANTQDTVWVHDYQLIKTGEFLRKYGFKGKIGFFLHIPFPAPRILQALPDHKELIESMCHYDLIGFQTGEDLKAFVDYLETSFDAKVTKDKDSFIIETFGKRFKAGSFPISIDVEKQMRNAQTQSQGESYRKLSESLNGKTQIIGVDRLDYSKGLFGRMKALELLISNYPELRQNIQYLQITPHSRSELDKYKQTRIELDKITGNINATYGEMDWLPVHYLNKKFSSKTLAGFYRLSKVGLVTSLNDGMNLVAKEYLASQDAENPGVLILSKFAGASQELDSAIIINPYDIEQIARAIYKALNMSLEERKERYRAGIDVLLQNDIYHWAGKFLDVLYNIKSADLKVA